MRLLITGAGGMLSTDVLTACAAAGHEALGLSREELDITDSEAVGAALAEHSPDAVINCAAWTDVDGAEADERTATEVNGAGAGHVARAAAGAGAFVVHVSTDYVFDGEASEPYVERDEVDPRSAYGRSKLVGEAAIAAAAPGAHAIARTSWLFGVHGRNFVETMLRVGTERDEVRVVDDQVGCPTYTGHLAPALVELAAHRHTGIFHVAASGSCSWFDFAREIFARAGVECRVTPQTTAELGRPAPRPAFSVLTATRPDAPRLPDWRQGLDDYLTARAAVAGAIAR